MFLEVMGRVWWPVLDTGFGFGPGGPEGPWGWMLVFRVRIKFMVVFRKVMGSLWWHGVRVRARRARRALPAPWAGC